MITVFNDTDPMSRPKKNPVAELFAEGKGLFVIRMVLISKTCLLNKSYISNIQNLPPEIQIIRIDSDINIYTHSSWRISPFIPTIIFLRGTFREALASAALPSEASLHSMVLPSS